MGKVIWKAEPDAHDYPAAASYLSLVAASAQVSDLVEELKAAPIEHYKAKDMLRASGLALLTPDNPHVAADLAKVHNNKALSPVLLIRGDLTAGVALQIADGYHRVCASYHLERTLTSPAASPTTLATRSHLQTRPPTDPAVTSHQPTTRDAPAVHVVLPRSLEVCSRPQHPPCRR